MPQNTRNPQQIMQEVQKHPHMLNELTEAYLEQMCYVTGFAKWESVQQLIHRLNNEKSFPKFILLLNTLRLIINSTFNTVDGLKGNVISEWTNMIYAHKCNQLAERLQVIDVQRIEQNEKNELISQICYGLIMSDAVFKVTQQGKKMNNTGRVFYPEFYRFLVATLEVLSVFNPCLKAVVMIQSQNKPEQLTTISLTTIFKQLQQMLNNQISIKNNKQKSTKSTKSIKTIKTREEVLSQVLANIISLLLRSFELAKTKIIRKMKVVAQTINNLIHNFVNQIQHNPTQNTLPALVQNYLTYFQDLNTDHLVQQIDEQNKIISVKQLTPKFANEDTLFQLKKLRTKKKKLIKKIQSDAKTVKINKLQEQKVRQDVHTQRVAKKQKKEIFVLQKQTEEAKKQHRKLKKVKMIQKDGKKGDKSGKGDKKKQHKHGR